MAMDSAGAVGVVPAEHWAGSAILGSHPNQPVAMVFRAIYTPLILACELTKPTKDGLQQYVSLWNEDLAIGTW